MRLSTKVLVVIVIYLSEAATLEKVVVAKRMMRNSKDCNGRSVAGVATLFFCHILALSDNRV
ncbi:hypothetical protein [Secundilactobacillus paracollinoides]|uniref:hypothetical protein n=1 Tax=Secundilactobacillus paracollinoides TaxID=240427 RepID=UPI00177C788F|nr:hypothetical protein [Secundilactobacillus paracollinoides]